MSQRRQARRQTATAAATSVLPRDLAAGPCIEVWAGQPSAGGQTGPAWCRARQTWWRAVVEWATSSGWAHEGKPCNAAINLARTRQAWSRKWLLDHDRADLVDYYEGHGPRPLRVPLPSEPMHG